jgi:hypothetical protein
MGETKDGDDFEYATRPYHVANIGVEMKRSAWIARSDRC